MRYTIKYPLSTLAIVGTLLFAFHAGADPSAEDISRVTQVQYLERAAASYDAAKPFGNKPVYLWERYGADGKLIPDSYLFAPADPSGKNEVRENEDTVRRRNPNVQIEVVNDKATLKVNVPADVKPVVKPQVAAVDNDALSKQTAHRDRVHASVFDLSMKYQVWEQKVAELEKNRGAAYSNSARTFELTQARNRLDEIGNSLKKALVDLGTANKRVMQSGGTPRKASFATMMSKAGSAKFTKSPFGTGIDIQGLSAEDPIPNWGVTGGNMGGVR